MKIANILQAASLVLCVLVTCGDGCLVAPNPGTGAGGFPVTSQAEGVDSAGNVVAGPYPEPGQYVTGQWSEDELGAAGTALSFQFSTDDNGNGFVNNGRINSIWYTSITWNPACNGYTLYSANADVNPVVGIPWLCEVYIGDEGPFTSTHFALPGAVPATITSYGDFSTTYGEPQLRIYVGGATPASSPAFRLQV